MREVGNRLLAAIAAAVCMASAGCTLLYPFNDRSTDTGTDQDGTYDPLADDDSTEGTCTEDAVPIEWVGVDVLFIVDRSMSNPLLDIVSLEMKDACMAELSVGLMAEWRYGLMLYPGAECGTAQCDPPTGAAVAIASASFGAIGSALESLTPCGSTPLAETLVRAGNAFPADNGNDRAAILLSAGPPTCNDTLDGTDCTCTTGASCAGSPLGCLDDVACVTTVSELFTSNDIDLHVVAVSEWAPSDYLGFFDDLADAGGTAAARQFDRDVGVLCDMGSDGCPVSDIIKSIAPCKMWIEAGVVLDPDMFNVHFNEGIIPRDTTRSNGWDWTSEGHDEIQFYGDWCIQVRSSPGAVTAGYCGASVMP